MNLDTAEPKLPEVLYRLVRQNFDRAFEEGLEHIQIYRRLSDVRPSRVIEGYTNPFFNDSARASALEEVYLATLHTRLEALLGRPPHARQDIFGTESNHPEYMNAFAGRWVEKGTRLRVLVSIKQGLTDEESDSTQLWREMINTFPESSNPLVSRFLEGLTRMGFETVGDIRKIQVLHGQRMPSELRIFDARDPLWLPKI